MNQQQVKVTLACAALAAGIGLVAWQWSHARPKATEDMVLEAFATRDINVLKQTRLRWAAWIESTEADPKGDAQKLRMAKDNLRKLDTMLQERGVDPASITPDSIDFAREEEK